MKLKELNTLSPFDWFLIAGVIAVSSIYSYLEGVADFTGMAAAISGVICVVLVAKGNILNYIFGIVNVSLYAYISFKAALYGDSALNALYYLPMQFIGWYSWMKGRGARGGVTILAKRMTKVERVILLAISTIALLIIAYLLDLAGDPQPLKDSATTVLSVIAMFLMVRRYMEQWVLWVVVNIISVIMWSVALSRGESHSALMVIMWLFYLANSINGWYTWLKLSKSDR